MSIENQKIIAMITHGASANEIVAATGLSHRQLFYRMYLLESMGYVFNKSYYSTGDIVYEIKTTLEKESVPTIITRPGENRLTVATLADLHLNSVLDDVALLNIVYDFCAKEGIHLIINGGDLLDGFFGRSEKRHNTGYGQVRYFLDKYPFDPHIINCIILGNHDKDLLDKLGIDLRKVFAAYRHDFLSLGYGCGKLRIKRDAIYVKHHVKNGHKMEEKLSGLIFAEHSHLFRYVNMADFTKIIVPSLSHINHDEFPFPSFLKTTINFSKGIITYIDVEQYICTDKIYKVNEAQLPVNSTKKYNDCLEEFRLPYRESGNSRKRKL